MQPPAPNSFRSLVLPREHGSWSLALEPVALGLLVAPSRAGAWLALAAIAGFFARRPLKLAATLPATDARRAATGRWTLLFAALAFASLLLSAGSGTWRALWPLLLAAPFGGAFLWFDLRGEMREAEAELAGSAAFASLPAAFATLAGWSAPYALALAGLMLARSLPTVLVVRACLRRAKGRPGSLAPATLAVTGALAGVLVLVAMHLVPANASTVAFVLFARALWLLSPWAPQWSARRIGITEAVLGLATLAALAWIYHGLQGN